MPIKVSCNNCGGVLHAPDDAAGKRGRCPTCGTILTITADVPRPSALPTPFPPSGDVVRPAGFPPHEASPAFPRPPAIGGDGVKSSYALGTKSAAEADVGRGSSHIPPAPQTMAFGGNRGGLGSSQRKFGDPFAKPSSAVDPIVRQWERVRIGLRQVQIGAIFKLLALTALAGLIIAEQYGVKLPEKKPGYLGAASLAANDEIKAAVTGLFWVIAAVFVVVGRFGIASAPPSSHSRGLAKLAAAGTLFGALGGIAMLVFFAIAASHDAPPHFAPQPETLANGVKMSGRVESYLHNIMLSSDDTIGQGQRYALAAVFAGIGIGEIWFLAALGRLAAHLRSDRAAARLTRYLGVGGILLGIVIFTWLTYDMASDNSRNKVWANWDALTPAMKTIVPLTGAAIILWMLGIVYLRVLGGVRQAVVELTEPSSPFGR